MTLPAYAVDFRGKPACPCLAAWLPVYEAELQRIGAIAGPLRIFQLIGGNPSSGGTHTQGGAFDVAWVDSRTVSVARQMGADATWHRWFNWDSNNGIEHVHGVLTGCPHNSPARYQVDAVRAGFDGLGHLGQGGRDDGPRPLSGRTWEQGIEWAEEQDMASEETIAAIAEAVAKRLLDAEKVDRAGEVSVRQSLNQTRNDAAKAAAK